MSFAEFLTHHQHDDTSMGDVARDTLTDLERGCLKSANAFAARRHVATAHPQSSGLAVANLNEAIGAWAMSMVLAA